MLYGSGQRIRARHVGHEDLAACVNMLPPWLPVDDELRAELPKIWTRLLWQPGFNADLIEDVSLPPAERMLGLGMAIALDEHWQKCLREMPPRYVALEIYRALAEERFHPPSDRQLGEMNRDGRVCFLVLHYAQRLTDLSNPDTLNLLAVAMHTFRNVHAGYRLEALYQEGQGSECEYLPSMGFQLVGKQVEPGGELPRLYGLDRSQAARLLPGSPVRDAFQFTPPILGFSGAERRVLRLAVAETPDERIAQELGITGHTVKKIWRGVYDRVSCQLPHLFSDTVEVTEPEERGTRGPEKKRWLLQYLRQHPEELRPYELSARA